MGAVFLLAFCLPIPFKDLGDLDDLDGSFAKSHCLAGLTYACPMSYVVEDGIY